MLNENVLTSCRNNIMNDSSRIHWPATIAVLTATLCWASIPLFLKSFVGSIDAWTANGFRYPLVALMWTIPLIFFMRQGRVPGWAFGAALIPTFFNVFNQTFWGLAPYYVEPGMIMFLGRTSLLFSIVIAFVVFPDERMLVHSWRFWVGLVLCVSGFVGMNVLGDVHTSPLTLTGVLIVLGHALFASIYSISVRHFMRGIRPWVSFPIICNYTSVVMLILMVMWGNPADLFTLSEWGWVMLVLSAVLGVGIAHTCFYYAIENIGVSISAGCVLMMPFITSAGSYVLYGEQFSPGQWTSGILIFAGAGLLILAQQNLGDSPEPSPVPSGAPEVQEISNPGDRKKPQA